MTILRAAPIVAGELEAEPPREEAAGWLAVASAVVGRHGGALERPEGTELVATFGLGAAREDDALRAVRAGSEIREGSDRLGTDWRCRIETHELLTGDGRSTARPNAPRETGLPARRRTRSCSTPPRYASSPVRVEAVPAADGSDYRLLGLVDGAPAVRRRFDAVLVGRRAGARPARDGRHGRLAGRCCGLRRRARRARNREDETGHRPCRAARRPRPHPRRPVHPVRRGNRLPAASGHRQGSGRPRGAPAQR